MFFSVMPVLLIHCTFCSCPDPKHWCAGLHILCHAASAAQSCVFTVVFLIWAKRVYCRNATQPPWFCLCANYQLRFCVQILIASASLLMLCGVGKATSTQQCCDPGLQPGVYCGNTGYDARLYSETRAHDHLKTHVLVQSLGNSSASSVLKAVPSQVQSVQRHIVQQALCQILGP